MVLSWDGLVVSGGADLAARSGGPDLHAEEKRASTAYRRALDANDWRRAGDAALRLAEIAILQADFEEAFRRARA